MRKILIPVDGAPQSETAVRAVVAQASREPIGAIHLLNVQPTLGRYVRRFVDGTIVRGFLREEGERCLAGARRILENAGLPYSVHLRVGRTARGIAETAAALGVDEIVMSAEGGGLFGNLRMWLLITAVRRLANLPVLVVMGTGRERGVELPIDRWGRTVPR
jgi:nucleotide-binding universal stress UspA family protein